MCVCVCVEGKKGQRPRSDFAERKGRSSLDLFARSYNEMCSPLARSIDPQIEAPLTEAALLLTLTVPRAKTDTIVEASSLPRARTRDK